MKKLEFKGVKFLVLVVAIYAVLFILDFDNSLKSFYKFCDILVGLLPIFLLL